MSRRHELTYALNAGAVDPEAVARVDLEKMRLAGEQPVVNLLPRVLGPATLRPGSESLSRIAGDAECRQIPFVDSAGTAYVLLLTPGEMRITLDGVVQQVPNVSTTINHGSWTDASTSPASASLSGTISLNATATLPAKFRNAVTVALADQATTHILRVVVDRGRVALRVGTTAGGQEIRVDTWLETGTHKISFVPNAGTIYLQLMSEDSVTRVVSTVDFEADILGGAGDLVLPTPWSTVASIRKIRKFRSNDVLFVGDGERQQRRIETRGALSWSVSLYKTNDGPFTPGSNRITMTPGALTGNTTITASEQYFQDGHAGALIELTQTNKTVSQTFNGADQTSDYITVIGVDAGRIFQRSGSSSSFVGTVVLERSFDPDEPSVWTTYLTYVDGAVAFSAIDLDDTLDNLTVHYRFRSSAYTSGSATMTLTYAAGVQTARARITAVNSTTSVDVEVIRSFGNTSATRSWRIGAWSDVLGWPRVPVIHDGRMNWFGPYDYHYAGDARDDYYAFDDDAEGDSAPFTRTLQARSIVWAASQDKLIAGTPTFEGVIQASELDEPLTPTRWTVRRPSRRGCADIEPAEHDDGIFFVQRSGRRLYELSIPDGSSRYNSQDMSRLNPAAYRAGIAGIVVQQQPDTRVYAWLDDGTVSVLTFDRDDKVIAITTMEIEDGLVEDVCVVPDTDQDDVYLIVNRSGARYHERLAKEAHQTSKSTCALLDAHKMLTGSISSITGGTHLAGQTVQVWADGVRLADKTLDGSGVAALGGTYSRVVYGLGYTASFKSVKLSLAAQLGTALGQTKIIHGLGVILANSCLDGVRVGQYGYGTTPLPDVVDGSIRTENQHFTHYDKEIFPVNGNWDADARLYVEIDSAEGPCTLQAIVIDVETRDGAASGNG